jgi:uracil-DNA glycosylase
MGLAPLWRLRARDAAPGDAQSLAASAPEPSAVSIDPPAMAASSRALIRETAPARALPEGGGERTARIARLSMDELKAEVKPCSACGLCKSRTQTVFGVGDESADWMIVGEAPGAEEDARGEPFVGQAGRLLDNMLAAIGLARGENVYIANVLKCRPPGNRNPEAAEVAQCSPLLARQIELVQPKLIIAMGRFAAQTLLNSDASIASMRGKLYRYQGVQTIVTYHPAYLLRSLPEKAKAWEDLCFARANFKS